MANQEIKLKVSVDAETGKLKVISDEVEALSKNVNDSNPKMASFNKGIGNMGNHAQDSSSSMLPLTQNLKNMVGIGAGITAVAGAFFAVKDSIYEVVKAGIEHNRTTENIKNALTTLAVATSSNVTSTGKAIDVTEKYTLAGNEASEAMAKLAKINADTPHNLNQTVEIYKAMYASMKSAGVSTDQMVELTKKVSIAAGSAGIEFNQLLAGVDGLATGTVEANSEMGRFLSSLGLSNEVLKDSKNIYETINEKLKDVKGGFGSFDEAVSNAENSFSQFAGSLTQPIFEFFKEKLVESSGILDGWTKSITEARVAAQKPFEAKGFDQITIQANAYATQIQELKTKLSENDGALWFGLDTRTRSEIENNIKKLEFNMENLGKRAMDIMESTSTTGSLVVLKTAEQLKAEVEAKKKAEEEKKKIETEAIQKAKQLNEDHSKWVIDISDKTSKAQADEISKPYVELQIQYDKDLAKYGKFTGAKNKLDEWYASELNDINDKTAKKIEDQNKKDKEQLEKKTKEENANLISSSKQRQEYYEKMEDYASAWAELERVLRLDDTKLTKDELDKKIAYEKKAYLESKGIYENLYSAISSNIEKSTKDWANYNLIVGKGFSSMVTGLQSTMQSSLVDVFEGKIKKVGDFFSTLLDSIKKSFFNMVAEMATKTIIMNFMNAWKPGGNTGKGFVETFLGIDIPFLNFAEGTIWGSGKYGLAGGGYNSVDAYRNDTIPAMISKGEAVIPASAVNKNKSVVSALIAGSRLDNRGLLDVSYIQKIVSDLKGPSMFAGGYDPNELGLFDKASIDANGFYNLKGGGKGGILGAVLGGIIGAFTGGLGTILVSAALGGAAGSSGLLDPIIEMVAGTFGTLMKVPWLGWVAQAALALYAPYLIPTMLTSDLLSTGVTLAMGGDLSQALGGAGISGLLAGGGTAISSLIKDGALPVSKLTFWETLQNYPSDLYKTTLDKFSQVKDFLSSITSPSALVNPSEYIGVDQTAWLESGTPLEYTEWAKQQMEAQYAAMSSADLFSGTSFANNGGSFLDYPSAYANNMWGFSSYDLIGQPASMSMVDAVRDKLISGFEYAKGMGTTAFDTLQGYLTNPEKIFQYILDNLRNVIENIAVSISSMAGSPLISALVGSGIAMGSTPFSSATGVTAFANGGIVTHPTLGLVGEAGYSEAIIPLHRLGEVTGMDEMNMELAEIKAILREVLAASKKTSSYTEDFAVIGIKTR